MDGTEPIWFGGGKLARDLTLPSIRNSWEQTAEDRKDAVLEWSATKPYFLGRESVLGDPEDWLRAVASVERSVERLLAVPASDLATWRGAAREAAGIFAAWSRRIEGDSPGPMAAAADLLARSAQGRPGEPLPNRAAVRDFRGVAAIVAQSELNNDSPMAWAMLISQLGQTLRAIGDAHAARGEAQMAEALGARSADELLQLQERFETTSARELAPGELTWEGRIASAIGEVAENQSGQRREHGLNRLRGIEH